MNGGLADRLHRQRAARRHIDWFSFPERTRPKFPKTEKQMGNVFPVHQLGKRVIS